MSASTVSITGNPTAATRRRPVVADRKKQAANSVDLFPSSDPPQTNGDASAGAAADGKNIASGAEKLTVAAAHSRDVSHQSVLGDGLFERNSKDLAQLKKSVNNSTVSPRRGGRKSSAGKVERPRWLTVLSVFSKNFVLVLVLLGIVQIVKNLAMRNEVGKVGTELVGLNEFEGRITEVEGFVKTTAKMMQMQVEVADSKIEREIGGLRREMVKNIDEKTGSIESKLKKVELRSEGLERDVKELKSGNWATKDEFEKVYEELKKGKGGTGNLDLDEIRLHAREVVEKEIEKHAADGLGRVDYALAAGGAFVLKHSDPVVVSGRSGNWFLNGLRKGVHSDAEKILKPSFGEPGQCFALKGSSGFVLIRLRTAIVPEAVTLEHVSKNVAYDRSTSPKDCRVSGWLQGSDIDLQVSTEKIHLLADFTYDLEKSNAQTFKVVDSTPSALVDTVMLDFKTNQGNPSLTCIYRFRVHGHEADPASMMAIQP